MGFTVLSDSIYLFGGGSYDDSGVCQAARPSEAADSVAVALDGAQPRDLPSSLRALLCRESRLGAACPGQAEAHDRTPLARLVSGTGEGSQTYAALCSPAPARRRL